MNYEVEEKLVTGVKHLSLIHIIFVYMIFVGVCTNNFDPSQSTVNILLITLNVYSTLELELVQN